MLKMDLIIDDLIDIYFRFLFQIKIKLLFNVNLSQIAAQWQSTGQRTHQIPIAQPSQLVS